MNMVKKILDKLGTANGVVAIVVVGPEDDPTAGSVPPMCAELRHAIKIARFLKDDDEDMVTILLGEIGPGQRKIVTGIWPDHHVAVEAVAGHPVNKSLRRMLRRAGQKFGGLKVESRLSKNKPAAAAGAEPSNPAMGVDSVYTGPR